MGKGYLDRFLQSKSNKSSQSTSRQSKKRTTKESIQNGLTDIQISAYQWLHDKGILPLIDNLTKQNLASFLIDRNFLAIFKIGAIFKVFVTPPKNVQLSRTMISLQRLLDEMKEKRIIPIDVNHELIAKGNNDEIIRFLTFSYEYSIIGNEIDGLPVRLKKMSDFLLSLGIYPPPNSGKAWFTNGRPLYLIEDPIRNGELFRSLCIVFRPELYEPNPPPAKTPREMAERIRQALVILSEDDLIDEGDILCAESIVRGTTDTAERIIEKIMISYEKRAQTALNNLAIKF